MKYMKYSMLSVVFLLAVSCFVNVGFAEPDSSVVNLNTIAKSEFELTAAVPLLKIRQGENFRLFDGAAGGIKWSPFYKESGMMKDFHVDALAMVSSYEAKTVDPAGNATKDQLHILSAGVVIGLNWFQIGVGRDMISSEDQNTFDKRKKSFLMLNLGATINF